MQTMMKILSTFSLILLLLLQPICCQAVNQKIDITNEYSIGYTIEYYTQGIETFYTLHDAYINWGSLLGFQPPSIKGFAEFDLSPWNRLNLPFSSITKIELTLEDYNPNSPSAFGPKLFTLFDMLSLEDQIVTGSLENQFTAPAKIIGDFIWEAEFESNGILGWTYNESISMDVYTSVINDIGNNLSFTGFVLDSDESMGNIATNNPILSIYYDVPAVPEPFTMALFALGVIYLTYARKYFSELR